MNLCINIYGCVNPVSCSSLVHSSLHYISVAFSDTWPCDNSVSFKRLASRRCNQRVGGVVIFYQVPFLSNIDLIDNNDQCLELG